MSAICPGRARHTAPPRLGARRGRPAPGLSDYGRELLHKGQPPGGRWRYQEGGSGKAMQFGVTNMPSRSRPGSRSKWRSSATPHRRWSRSTRSLRSTSSSSGRALVSCAILLLQASAIHAQDLGHKLPGGIGLDAGKAPPEPGFYLVDRFVTYDADQVRDRRGDVVPVKGLRIGVLANGFGVAWAFELPRLATRASVTVAAPLVDVRLNSDAPEASVERFGLADVFIQPLKLGWRRERFEAVTSYGLYVPTGTSPLAGGRGVSNGQVTHEFAGGGTYYFDEDRAWYVTALASYQLNQRKRGIDITRGDLVQVQGGMGVSLLNRRLDLGIVGFALSQVRDDRGADVPPVLRGARDEAYGLGPEIVLSLRPLPARMRLRYERDVTVKSRPQGEIFLFSLEFAAWRPRPAVTLAPASAP